MGMELTIGTQVYSKKRKKWETVEVEKERFSTNSAKEAFHEYCDKMEIFPSIEERAWKSRKKRSNAVFVNTKDGRKQVGFTFSISYSDRTSVVFSRFEERYVKDLYIRV